MDRYLILIEHNPGDIRLLMLDDGLPAIYPSMAALRLDEKNGRLPELEGRRWWIVSVEMRTD